MSEIIPTSITKGDSLTIDLSRFVSDYAPHQWKLAVVLTGVYGQYRYKSPSTAIINISWSETAKWAGRKLNWRIYADSTDGQQRKTLASGSSWVTSIDVEPQDGVTHAEKALAAIEAVLENSATYEQQQMMLMGRSLMRYDPMKLIELRDYYRSEVKKQKGAENNPSQYPFGKITILKPD